MTAETLVCTKQVTHDGWHFMKCGKPAKYKVGTTEGKTIFCCGIHVREYRRLLETGKSVVTVGAL